MIRTSLILGLVGVGLAGCVTTSPSDSASAPANPTSDRVSQGEMPAYCRGEAAAKFKQRPQDISTLPAERDHGMFTVYGQTPAEGQNALFFTCTFTAEGKLVGVDKQSDNRAQSQSQSSAGVAVKDMPRYCAGEASAKFNQRPQNISTQPATKDKGMYSVFGQFPPSGANPTVFICTFTAEGKLVGVDKQ